VEDKNPNGFWHYGAATVERRVRRGDEVFGGGRV
jgi:hypothetical protein